MMPEQKKRGGAHLARTQKAATPQRGGKKKKVKRTPKQQTLHILFVVAIVLLSIIVVLGSVYLIWVKPPALPAVPDRPKDPVIGVVPGQTEEPGTEVTSDRKKDYFTFLMIGRDTYGGGNTDTMMLASYDIPNQKLNVMSIPRDTLVNVSWDIKKINSVYNVYGGGDDGMTALKEESGQLVGFQPDFTVTIEWKAVGELVNAIGGVNFDVPRRMYYNDLSQNFKIDLKKGYQKLNGSQAMQLLRYRHDSDDSGHILNSGYADGDLGRIKVQQDFLKATIEQCLQKITDLGTIGKLAQVFFDNVKTELSVGNLAWFAQQAILGNDAGRLGMENVNFITMPWVSASGVRSRTYNNYPSYVAPSVDELVTLVNESFNPYMDPLRKNELDIMYVNKDGTLGCTSGNLQDTKYNNWIVGKGSSSGTTSSPKPSNPPEPTAEPTESPEPSTSPSTPPGTSTSPNPGTSASPSPSPGISPSPEPSTMPSPSASPSQAPSPSPTPSLPPVESESGGPPPGIPF